MGCFKRAKLHIFPDMTKFFFILIGKNIRFSEIPCRFSPINGLKQSVAVFLPTGDAIALVALREILGSRLIEKLFKILS